MRVFKMKGFVKFARTERIGDSALCEAVERAQRGLIDADLGGHVIKQRVARPNQGRSGGYRVIIGYQHEQRAVFLFGFGKNERANISPEDLLSLRAIAAMWCMKSDAEIEHALTETDIEEIYCGKET